MNRDEAKGYIKHAEVIKAFANGDTIEFKSLCTGAWAKADTPAFHENYEYRVKPKLIECWANVYDGHLVFHRTESDAKVLAGESAKRVAVRLVEAK